jgi:hypothetical protein
MDFRGRANLIAEHQLTLGVGLADDSRAAGRWETSAGGEYFAAGVGGSITAYVPIWRPSPGEPLWPEWESLEELERKRAVRLSRIKFFVAKEHFLVGPSRLS